MKVGKIIFITGTSGAGKSTLKKLLMTLESDDIKIHDFDEVGVPEGADQNWRIAVSKGWLEYSYKNSRCGINTLILGQTSPKEISELARTLNISDIKYGFIDIEDSIIRSRLKDRNWDPELIDANVNWAKVLKSQLMQQDEFIVYNGNSSNEIEMLTFYKNWIMKLIN